MTDQTNGKPKGVQLYGLDWGHEDPITIERSIIRAGGYIKIDGRQYGNGVGYHYKEFIRRLWPEKKWHRWSDLIHESILENTMVGIMGPASSGKTHDAGLAGLSKFLIFPECSSVLVSSTDARSLELRIWGEIKKYWRMAKEVWAECPGHLIESRQMIVAQEVDAWGRDFRNGIIGIPCVVGGTFVGLGKYVGIKNENVMLVADELQFMAMAFMDAISNLNKNPNFTCVGLGNPKDPEDCLGKLCEPAKSVGGWEGVEQGKKTSTWETRFEKGICIQLVGTDSPNFDYPEDQPKKFPFLIGRKEIAADLAYYGPDSLQFSMMNLGVMPKSAQSRRVITRAICNTGNAFDKASWFGLENFVVAGLDAAYGLTDSDRTVLTILRCGRDVDGIWIMSVDQNPIVITVDASSEEDPEDQIAVKVRDICTKAGIAPQNLGFDSTGRGSLMSAFARLWSPYVVPIEFGGLPTDRIVSDAIKMPANEHFSKRVTELWYQVRYIIEAGQFRQMNEEILAEGSSREWTIVRGNKIEVEAKKITKKRMGRSPDIFDSLVAAAEIARSRGFMITPLANASMAGESSRDEWLRKFVRRNADLRRSKSLSFSA